ncbi:MAG: exonuclease domain-containing protein [Acidobacteriota bacterium]
MTPYPNLISDSLLITDTIDLLRSFGGSASAVNIVDYVMKIRKPEPNMARLLVSDLVERDPRLQLNDNIVELLDDRFSSRVISETEFVVFDLETTGAKAPPHSRITEIGAYRVKNGKIVDEFQTLVNPRMSVPPFIIALTGISDEMLRAAPRFDEVIREFLDFIGDAILVAHNANFDMHFLNHEIGMIYEDYRMMNPCLCTVHLSRKLLPHIENHKLKTLAEYFSVPLVNHHRAGPDARATAEVFVNLLEQLNEGGFYDIAAVKKLGTRKAYVG